MIILDRNNLSAAVDVLKKGGTLVYPTETSYGLGCDASNQKAVDRIFNIKSRQRGKSILVIVPTVAMARKYLAWNNDIDKLASKYWPGPLTIVGRYIGQILRFGGNEVDAEYRLANGVVSEDDTVAVRVTANPVAQSLSQKLNKPLVATSANISKTSNIYESEKLINVFSKREFMPDALLDYGVLPRVPSTTIVSVLNGEIRIVRQGDVIVHV